MKFTIKTHALVLVDCPLVVLPMKHAQLIAWSSSKDCLVKKQVQTYAVSPDERLNHRAFITEFAKKNNLPIFIKQNSHGVDVPVILLNKTTAPKLKGLMENSFGTLAALQKDWNNDHGLLRAGKYIIDLDTPGARGFGEIENTGLAWKNIETYMPKRSTGSSPMVEVTYLLSPEEKSIIEYYQKVRRAALFRVKFTFKGNKTADYPNLLNNGGEHCFIFCKAQAVDSHVYEIKSKLQGLGVKDPDKFLNDEKLIEQIAVVEKFIIDTPADDVRSTMLNNKKILTLFDDFYPADMKTDLKKVEFVNWLISYDSSKRYAKVLDTLGVSGDYGLGDAINTRASAIFIYDEAADPAAFKNATYSNFGKFVSWPTTKQFPAE